MEINPEFNNILADAIAKQNEAERIIRENTEIVVRCKDCIQRDMCEYACSHDDEWFCADGVRRFENG